MNSQADNGTRPAEPPAKAQTPDIHQRLLAGGSLLGALAASSCCLVPLALFGIGAGGAWIAYLTRLAPYQPYFLGLAALSIGGGYWLRRRSKRAVCTEDGICTRPLPDRIVMLGFAAAGALIASVIALNLFVPFFL
ncbi:MAG: mercuric transporter MerT family protein [Alphaproteobacteria bacterium]